MHKKTGTSSTFSYLNFIRKFRKEAGYKQEDFAEVLEMDRSNYGKKETGAVPITLEEWVKIVNHVAKEKRVSLDIKFKPTILPSLPADPFLPETIQSFPILKKLISEANEAAKTKDKKLLIKILEYIIDKLKEPEPQPQIKDPAKLQQNH